MSASCTRSRAGHDSKMNDNTSQNTSAYSCIDMYATESVDFTMVSRPSPPSAASRIRSRVAVLDPRRRLSRIKSNNHPLNACRQTADGRLALDE